MAEAASFTTAVPGIYGGLLKLIREAAAGEGTEVAVMPFRPAQFEPKTYVIVGPVHGPRYEVEAIPLQLLEMFEITGMVVVFTGETPTAEDEPEVALEAMTEAFNVFTNCVIVPALEKRGAPTFGTTGPSAQKVEPVEASHDGKAGVIGGQPGGWMSTIEWGIHFECILNPTPVVP